MGEIVSTMPYWLGPLIGGIGAGLQHGAGAEGKLVPAWGNDPNTGIPFAPTTEALNRTAMGDVMRPNREMMAATIGRMRQPIVLDPATTVQTPFGIGGSGMFSNVWLGGQDPAQRDASALGRPGLNVGATLGRPYNPETQNIGTISQVPPRSPQYGGGIPEVQKAIDLLYESKFDTEAFEGNLWAGGLFTGAAPEMGDVKDRQGNCSAGTVWSDELGWCVEEERGPSSGYCPDPNERWDEALQKCVPIDTGPTDDETSCLEAGRHWCPTGICVDKPSDCVG